jgi:hypothetical protein
MTQALGAVQWVVAAEPKLWRRAGWFTAGWVVVALSRKGGRRETRNGAIRVVPVKCVVVCSFMARPSQFSSLQGDIPSLLKCETVQSRSATTC